MSERKTCTFKLNLGDRTMEASVAVPTSPLRPVEMLPLFLAFTEAITSAAAERVQAEGKRISCRAGCGACCSQLVVISETEMRYIAEMVEEMPEERRAHVQERFAQSIAAFDAAGMLDQVRGVNLLPTPEERRAFALRYFRAGVACPFLEDNACSIYHHRPMACREYLVTSPAANCSQPTAETVELVQLAVKPSQVMCRFDDARGEGKLRYLPLVLALEWFEAHKNVPQPSLPGPEMLENFLYQIRARVRRLEPEG